MRYRLEIAGTMRQVDVSRRGAGWAVRIDTDAERVWDGQRVGSAEWRLTRDGIGRAVRVVVDGDRWIGQTNGAFVGGEIADPRVVVANTGGGGQGTVKAPMPGMVVRVLVAVGQAVTAGQVLLVVEAMKMENELKSKIAGIVRELHVAPGHAVAANAPLVTVEPGAEG